LRFSIFGGTVNVWRCAEGNQVYLAGTDVPEVIEAAKQYLRDFQHQCSARPSAPSRLKMRPVSLDTIKAHCYRPPAEDCGSLSTKAGGIESDDAPDLENGEIIAEIDATLPRVSDVAAFDRLSNGLPPVKNTFIHIPAAPKLKRANSF
jgi:hypothetical protein